MFFSTLSDDEKNVWWHKGIVAVKNIVDNIATLTELENN